MSEVLSKIKEGITIHPKNRAGTKSLIGASLLKLGFGGS